MVERIALAKNGFTLEVAPTRGGAQTRFSWTGPDGVERDILRRPPVADIENTGLSLSKLSSFLMMPFANRIDGAAFSYGGQDFRLPLNRPEQKCAIHGHARDLPWMLVEASDDHMAFEVEFARDDTPFQFIGRQTYYIEDERAGVETSVTNLGDVTLPFGFGLHPWFPLLPNTRLQFEAGKTFDTDERTFPLKAIDVPEGLDFSAAVKAVSRRGIDKPYAEWIGGKVLLEQPDEGYTLEMEATGALTNLHIFIPEDQDLFCIEPVTHVTDVINRREFAPLGDMAPLAKGESLSGTMWMRPFL